MVTQIKDPIYFAQPQSRSEDNPELAQTADKVANLPNAAHVAVDYIQQPDGLRELVVEPIVYSLRWAEIAVTELGELVKGPQKLFESAGHFLLWAELPTQLLKLGRTVVKFGDSLANKAFVQAADKAATIYIYTTFLSALGADAVQVLYHEHLITLSTAALTALQTLGFMGNIALLINAIRGIKKQTMKLMESEPWTPPFNLALIRLSAKVCLAVVAIFSMAAFFTAIVYFTYIILIFSSILLILTLVAHFYEKTHVPDKVKDQAQTIT